MALFGIKKRNIFFFIIIREFVSSLRRVVWPTSYFSDPYKQTALYCYRKRCGC